MKSLDAKKLYSDLIKSETFCENVELIKICYRQNSENNPVTIEIIEKVIEKLKESKEWQRVIELYELLLEIIIFENQKNKEIEIVFKLLGYLNDIVPSVRFSKTIEITKKYLIQPLEVGHKISLFHLLIVAYLVLYGVDDEVKSHYQNYKTLVFESIESSTHKNNHFFRLISHGMISLYFDDSPKTNNALRQHTVTLGMSSVNIICKELIDQCKYNLKNRTYHFPREKIKLGYITNYLCQHSVGWLVRWTLHYHNPDLFEVYTYSTFNPNDKLHNRLIEQYGDRIRHTNYSLADIISNIQEDNIDILIDLSSLTEFEICVVTAIKPAPVQVTWLGMDASQIPAIDYYLADRYSLPDNAQEYYSEKLIKMPNCYIAVDGFEIDCPSVFRRDFGILDNSVIYLSSQIGAKRHPDNMKLQIQILSQVPNSYFLVKLRTMDEEVALEAFRTLAIEMGVDSDRIKVIPAAPTSEIHRANLKIADVILDTYPYNGATTTMEALWCEVPLVTRVGQQFAARNSYSMLMNAGVTEGIAWTDEEYVAWGVALGLNQDLRDRVRWKLRQSKRTSPLWDARQFTRDLEAVYQQVWDCYLANELAGRSA